MQHEKTNNYISYVGKMKNLRFPLQRKRQGQANRYPFGGQPYANNKI